MVDRCWLSAYGMLLIVQRRMNCCENAAVLPRWFSRTIAVAIFSWTSGVEAVRNSRLYEIEGQQVNNAKAGRASLADQR